MALGDRIANVQGSISKLRNPLAAGAQIRESGLDRQQRGMESALQAQAELNRQSEAGMKQLSDIGDTFVQRGVEKRAHANRLQMMREEHKESARFQMSAQRQETAVAGQAQTFAGAQTRGAEAFTTEASASPERTVHD